MTTSTRKAPRRFVTVSPDVLKGRGAVARFSFEATVDKLRKTPPGRETSMYPLVRDLFIHVLDYAGPDIDTDTAGEGGRPDLTVWAAHDAGDIPSRVAWIVVEAKAAHGAFRDPASRTTIFREKSKYITADTAWFLMIEPELWVLRSVRGQDWSGGADIEVPFPLTEQAFRGRLAHLTAAQAGVGTDLRRFRAGDPALIGIHQLSDPSGNTDTLRIQLHRRWFFRDIRETTARLQDAVHATMTRHEPVLREIQARADGFWADFGRPSNADAFDPNTLMLRSNGTQGVESARRMDKAAAQARRVFAQQPALARMLLHSLPAFQRRTGVPDEHSHEVFAVETANLIIARVLLLRFFEDHQFFDEHQRYICNGGIEAFQGMRQYFKKSYAALLRDAYEEGGRLYATVFDNTELDWVFGIQDAALSATIEWTLFRFGRYDFTTIQGDILTGIYDRFLDRRERKRLGEFFTPPSIARYIVRHVGIRPGDRVLDPACGSGTFLIEALLAMVGQDIERGIAEYDEVRRALEGLAGNDLNTFSSVLTQIQLLWHILHFKQSITTQGFPDLLVTAQRNSLVERELRDVSDRYSDLDQPVYDAVIGNPPYIRPERGDQLLSPMAQQYFERGGVSANINVYGLFLYRALDRWCHPPDENGKAGRVGFVVQLSLFDDREMASLRKLFALGGRWTLREIVDLEVVYKDVFDASVYTAIVIAERRPARPDDTVTVRFADASIVRRLEADAVPSFDLEALPSFLIAYADLFAPDGRILTRLTPARLAVLRKLWRHTNLMDAAQPFWVRRSGGKMLYRLDKPTANESGWTARHMITRGLVFRHDPRQSSPGGPDVYKAENIVATALQGDPVVPQVDLTQVRDRGPWAYQDILPERGYAIPRVAHCPNAVPFDPTRVAFTDTVTVFFPRGDLASVPFDLLLLSHIYIWFYALAARMGIVRALGSDIYPINFAQLPWTDALKEQTATLEGMRDTLVSVCADVSDAERRRMDAFAALHLPTLKQRVRRNDHATLVWSEAFDDPDYSVTINPRLAETAEGVPCVWFGPDLLDYVACSDSTLAAGLHSALVERIGSSLTRTRILSLSIPVTADDIARWDAVADRFQVDAALTARATALDRLDRVVGAAFGLSDDDIDEIQRDLTTDPFLQRIRPRYPGTTTRKQGFRTGLDLATRYTT